MAKRAERKNAKAAKNDQPNDVGLTSPQNNLPKMIVGERGAGVARLVGIEGGVVSGLFNLESSDVGASDRRPRHDKHYHEA